jgi:hypothetical protein
MFSQSEVERVYKLADMERSTSFAVSTFGLDLLALGQAATKIKDDLVELPGSFIPRLNIGATHFWGHAEFYVSFPLGVSARLAPSPVHHYNYSEGVETGVRIYPFALKKGGLAPFAGISFQSIRFSYALQHYEFKYGGSNYSRVIAPIQAGVSYMNPSYLFIAGVRYNANTYFQYYQNHESSVSSSFSRFNFSFSVLRHIDTNRSAATQPAVDLFNIKYIILNKENALSAWYWAVGLSSAIQLSKSSYFQFRHPYLYEDLSASIFPELAFGRYISKGDITLNIAVRPMKFRHRAFDTDISISRTSFAMEAYKSMFDYHGFVPFVGPSFMMDFVRYSKGELKLWQIKSVVGIVFGWDIRLTKTNSSLLRTNLRYAPGYHLVKDGHKIMLDHLEFNFIQYVHFIGRNNIYRKYSSKP